LIVPALVFAAALAGPAARAGAEEKPAPPVDSSARYAKCLSLAANAPVSALVEADAWLKQGGGAGANYCAAIALLSVGHASEAGSRLDALGQSL